MARDLIYDTSEVTRFGVTLVGIVGPRVIKNAYKATEVSLRNIKENARKTVRWSKGRRLAPLVQSIDYDIKYTPSGIYGETGYNRDKPQGNLGHIIEYGSSGGDMPNAPQNNLLKALIQEQDGYISALERAVLGGFD